MRVTWRGLELPTRVERDTMVSSDKYGRFFIEPFERGFGTTIGNSLRRVLLSSLEGSAVTSIKIANVDHEFTSISGVMEDTTDIVLNVKSLVVRLHGDGPKVMTVSANKAGVVTAADIVADPAIEVISQDAVLATLTEDVNFEMEMVVENGRGYVPASERIAAADRFDQEVGRILLDAVYSPVTRVRYTTEDTRVGQRTNYDKLILEVWTNGTTTPEMALVEASKILRKHINPFVQYFEVGEETVAAEITEKVLEEEAIDEEMAEKLKIPIQELELSVRASNCLESVKVETVGQLVEMTDADLLKIRSFGKTSLREIKRKLADIGLSLGMTDV
ncbi:MAG: DNA-directed RNA polymerase subunit alpha [Phycisphaerae bacterium]|nr:DNA-directed RNA polymerase subunit alpha [Phycisphaerae bacterium]NIP53675.1 DNA-directed RNA polymerase subunit alpha [Phycisphaerae bacterium]NIS52598.1 DNA-directed RNA polymerase subunit alpha [Phycisphaerae bacterium]NIU10077.1 DNA-directed RNA polymerase subunit alpha [Phycisphaerae bacterium]NIV02671.1 DNA-directed RNA polymerase subunit alpha [Phycisphaerae bacterium]